MLPSLHFIPAHRSEFYKDLNKTKATALIFDLEDGVPGQQKDEALKTLYNHKELISNLNAFIRVNRVNGGFSQAEINVIKELNFKGAVIPKVESKEDIANFCDKYGKARQDLNLICLIESFRGLEMLWDILKEHSEDIAGIGLGLEDFLSTVPVLQIGDNVTDYIRMKFNSTCKAFNLPCIDTVSLNFNERLKEFKRECLNSRKELFDGRFSIHPTQIPLINEIYPPSEEELNWATTIVDKVEGQKNIGYVKIGNEVISDPKVKKARLILKKAGLQNDE